VVAVLATIALASRAPDADAATATATDTATATATDTATATATDTATVFETPGARSLREGGTIDLNEAGVTDLVLLPRIGPRLAERIVADRTEHGRYRRLEDLERVSGVGPRTVERLRPLVRVTSPP
jgi:competence protein ComEA